jgi:hypothetical protein
MVVVVVVVLLLLLMMMVMKELNVLCVQIIFNYSIFIGFKMPPKYPNQI